ncbi:MAG: hypothetical protein QXW91_01875 [Candidatus Nitrosotenuis sp.]
MELEQVLHSISNEHSVGLGGCKRHGTTLQCCEYDVTVFDNKYAPSEIIQVGNDNVRIHHGSLEETNVNVLQQYEDMQIISDNDWSLRVFLSNLKIKKAKIRSACIKNCLVDAAFCATKVRQDPHDPFAAAMTKCAAYFIADALVLYNDKWRSPTHMLEFIRKSKKVKDNSFTVVAETLGLERATPSLLERMAKSTIGFSDMTENNGHHKIINAKYQYLTSNALLSDCYFYLGYVNRNNLFSIKEMLHKRNDLVHILKTALDFEHDTTKIEKQAGLLHNLANEMSHDFRVYA